MASVQKIVLDAKALMWLSSASISVWRCPVARCASGVASVQLLRVSSRRVGINPRSPSGRRP